ncbi:MAG: hypothetical protein GVY33_13950 [Alphaproteobacteria bacterium]|jgi:hypothetical protein|nr:hypothetical protein [Alphaproteobacteria bacterium]
MGDEEAAKRRGREAHAEEVARAMRENLKKRKAKARARRERAAGAKEPPADDAGPGSGPQRG